MDDRPRRWVLRRLLRWRDAGAIVLGCLAVMAALFSLSSSLPNDLIGGLFSSTWCLPVAVLWAWPRGRITTDADGITWRVGQQRGRLEWREVETVAMDGDGLRVTGGGQELRLERATRGLCRLASALQEGRQRQAVEASTGALDASTIADRLQIPVEGTLEVRPRAWRRNQQLLLGCLAAVPLLALPLLLRAAPPSTGPPLWTLFVQALVLVPVISVAGLANRRRSLLRTSASGLIVAETLTTERFVPWSSVWAKRTTWWRTLIDTDAGTIVLDTNREADRRIVEVVDHLLAARAAGRPLPRLSDVPEAALSRARVAVEVERGISRAGEGDG